VTWHHVAMGLIAMGLTLGVVHSPHASQAIGPVFNLDGIIIAGIFGHAGASILRRRVGAKEDNGHS